MCNEYRHLHGGFWGLKSGLAPVATVFPQSPFPQASTPFHVQVECGVEYPLAACLYRRVCHHTDEYPGYFAAAEDLDSSTRGAVIVKKDTEPMSSNAVSYGVKISLGFR